MAGSTGTTGGGYSLGVDLGTTYTAAAVWRDGRAEVVPLGDHSPQIPSALFRTEEGQFLVGEAAVRRGAADPGRLATEFKRRVGDETSIMVGGTPTSAHALMGQLLSWVVAHVTAGQGRAPDTVVLTCPANWGPYRRELMEQVGRIAGVGGVVICTEPSAAAVHFASTERVEVGDTIAVYDLGGGTFDAAVLRKDGPADFALLGSPEGLEHLGGLDFDAAVLQHVWRTVGDIDADPEDEAVLAALSRLRRDCTEAKEALSVDTHVTIPVDLDAQHRTVRLSRDELEELVRPSLEETVAAVERALDSADLTAAELGSVLLVGGSARIPLVTELLTRRLGRPVAVSAQPKHGVALGAAMVGAHVSGALSPGPPTPRAAGSPPREGRGAVPSRASAPPTPAPGLAASTVASDQASAASTTQTAPRAAPARAGAVARNGLLAAAALAALAVLATVLGPTVPTPDVTAQLDAERENATVVGASAPEDSEFQLTLAGQDLPSGRAVVTDEQAVNLSGARIYTVGPLPATLTTTEGVIETQLVMPDGAPWGRLLSLPGAVVVLGLLFAFAYGESLLRPMLRRAKRATPVTVIGMAAIGAVLGVVLVVATWILVARLHHPGTVVLALLACVVAASLVPIGLDGRRSARLSADLTQGNAHSREHRPR